MPKARYSRRIKFLGFAMSLSMIGASPLAADIAELNFLIPGGVGGGWEH